MLTIRISSYNLFRKCFLADTLLLPIRDKKGTLIPNEAVFYKKTEKKIIFKMPYRLKFITINLEQYFPFNQIELKSARNDNLCKKTLMKLSSIEPIRLKSINPEIIGAKTTFKVDILNRAPEDWFFILKK